MIKSLIHTLKRSRIIVGGGPLGASLAHKLTQNKQAVTLIHKANDQGSHHDASRLARLAFDGTIDEFKLSQQSILDLLKLHKKSRGKVIQAKPGVLFIASPHTPLATKLKTGEKYDSALIAVSKQQLNNRFPGYGFNLPAETLYWYHHAGYVINPIALTAINLQLAEQQGCEVIDDEAAITISDEGFHVSTHTHQNFNTLNLYLLTGARNKEIAAAGKLGIPEFNQTYLTAISTIRYQSQMVRDWMPITVGSVQLDTMPHLLDFSTMPESKTVIKTRLSGAKGSEEIATVQDKDALPTHCARTDSITIFKSIFTNLGLPIDFNRCVTYRNTDTSVNGLSFLNANYFNPAEGASQTSSLLTTLGCYGVHVKYSSIMANAMYQYTCHKAKVNGFHIDQTNLLINNFVKESLPSYACFLEQSGLATSIGNTPLKRIGDNLFLKQEGFNSSGSIKDRVALFVLLKKLETQEIKDGDTLVLATSGSYGVSVQTIKKFIKEYLQVNLRLVIITPFAYREKPGVALLRNAGLTEMHEADFKSSNKRDDDILLYADGVFAKAIDLAKSLRHVTGYVYLDQHYDVMHVIAHESTAKEIYEQLPQVTDVISVTGTGATAMGLSFFLPKHVRIHSRAAVSGEISGLADARNYNNFFKTDRIAGYSDSFLQKKSALKFKDAIKKQLNIEVSDSTGAALAIADDVKTKNPKAIIAVISPSFRY